LLSLQEAGMYRVNVCNCDAIALLTGGWDVLS
jgi:hypothetical protein